MHCNGIRTRYRILEMLYFIILLVSSCDWNPSSPQDGDSPKTWSFEFTFATGAQGWSAGFADYAPEQADTIEVMFKHEELPSYLDEEDGYGLFISGRNVSDDLFMFIKRAFTGLEPMTPYDVDVTLQIASNAREDAVGIGGSPGSSVYLKAGAAVVEPTAITQLNGSIGMNVDKGNQAGGGKNAVVLGNIGIEDNTAEEPYRLKTLQTTESFRISTGRDGVLWVFVGTDSGFEGVTAIYYTMVRITFTPR